MTTKNVQIIYISSIDLIKKNEKSEDDYEPINNKTKKTPKRLPAIPLDCQYLT